MKNNEMNGTEANETEDLSKETYLNLKQAAKHSHLGLIAIRGYIKAGALPAYRPRKVVVVLREELDAFIKGSRIKVAAKP